MPGRRTSGSGRVSVGTGPLPRLCARTLHRCAESSPSCRLHRAPCGHCVFGLLPGPLHHLLGSTKRHLVGAHGSQSHSAGDAGDGFLLLYKGTSLKPSNHNGDARDSKPRQLAWTLVLCTRLGPSSSRGNVVHWNVVGRDMRLVDTSKRSGQGAGHNGCRHLSGNLGGCRCDGVVHRTVSRAYQEQQRAYQAAATTTGAWRLATGTSCQW